jgi:hypothetical protein
LLVDCSVSSIGRVVNSVRLGWVSVILRVYVGVAVATVVVHAVLSGVGSSLATQEAWVHAAIVAVFAVVLPLRLRAAREGRRSGLRAVGIISGVLVLVNAVEATIPGLFPAWMRVEMAAVAALMALAVLLVAQVVAASRHDVKAG